MSFTKAQEKRLKKQTNDRGIFPVPNRITDNFLKFYGHRNKTEFFKFLEEKNEEWKEKESKRKAELRKEKRKLAYKTKKEIEAETKRKNKEIFDRLKNDDKEYLLNAKVVLLVQWDKRSKKYSETKEFNRVIKKKDLEQSLQEFEDKAVSELEQQSGVYSVQSLNVTHQLTTIDTNPKNLSDIPMRDAFSLKVDGEEAQKWDRKQGTCVFDYLIHRYSDIKGFKKTCTYEGLEHIFKQYDELEQEYLYKGSPLEDGVTTKQIKLFCEKYNIPMYALDADDYYFDVYYPENKNKNAPSLVFKIMNNHFYPVMQDEKKKKSIIQAVSNALSQSDIVRKSKALEEQSVINKEYKKLNVFENIEDPTNILIDLFKNTEGGVPNDKSISYSDGVTSFVYEDELYIINQDAKTVEKIYNNMKSKVEKPELLNNKFNLNMALVDLIKYVAKINIPKSSPNPHVYDTLIVEGVKARTHYGCVNGFTDEKIHEAMKSGNGQCCDINKCYSKCMYDPLSDWMLLDFNDCWAPFSGDCSKLGLYYVKTNDYTLLHGDNIYSNTILSKAKSVGVKFTVTKELIASKSAPKTLFKPILDSIKDVANGDKDVNKKLNNMLSGMLGKHEKKYFKVKINKDLDQVWTWFKKHGLLESKDIFVKRVDIDNDNHFFLYGQKFVSKMSETNIPIYFQIKDQANIMLYDMTSEMEGTLAYRKVDCAITVGGKYPKLDNENWGGYRKSDVPKYLGEQVMKSVKFLEVNDWVVHDVNDSDNWETILNVAKENKGLMLIGRAGTGKTFVAKQIASQLKNVSKIAFTNKAALQVGGKTIHKYLKMDKEGNISKELLNKIKEGVEFVIVDEISMITKDLWRRLVELKRYTGVSFILVGDNRQCPPVENEAITDYFDHPAIKYLTNNNKVELTVRHRYDKTLWDLLEDVDNVDTSKFGSKVCDKNICYYNRTRKYVNHMKMIQYKPKDAIFIQADPDDEYTQDVYLYERMPVIARKTVENGEVMVNNETFTVENIKNGRMRLLTERPDGEHTIEFDYMDFHKFFCVNYCSTTHKVQGETIVDDFTVWDWPRMCKKLKYTAMSRAKKPEQINFMSYSKKDNDDKLDKIIDKKIKGHVEYDTEKGFDTDIDVDYIKNLIVKQNYTCFHCNENVKVNCFQFGDVKQFSIDRKKDNIGHVKGNVCIACLECNRKHANKILY